MTIGIYCIKHIESGKRYIGKSVCIERRIYTHKSKLTKPVRDPKQTNRHLYNAVQLYGWGSFEVEVLESFDVVDQDELSVAELKWIDFYGTCNRENGYNLRRDSSTPNIVNEETRLIISENNKGSKNGNYGNYWGDDQKSNMSEIAKQRHMSGKFYGDEWRQKISEASSKMWEDTTKKRAMAKKVAKAKQKYKFYQFTKTGELIREWDSVEEIITNNQGYKWQNIYSVCNGYKKSYMGYVWKKELKI